MEEFHGIIVKESLRDHSVVRGWNVIRESKTEDWSVYTVLVAAESLNELVEELQEFMFEGSWYAHFYNKDGSKLIIVFKNRRFDVTSEKSTWEGAINYAESLNIPGRQLEFKPTRFDDES